MKRSATLILAALMIAGLAGCSKPASAPTTVSTKSAATATAKHPYKIVNKDTIFLHVTKTYDPSLYPMTAMTGEPSNIPAFDPAQLSGVKDTDYPTPSAKTFKFLSIVGSTLPPQWYYLFDQKGGALNLNKAVASTGYTFTSVFDDSHFKVLPNLYLGYYDFAWIPLNVMTEYWSGNESMNQELWREGNDYQIVAGCYDGGISMLAPASVTSLQQLAGKTVGIMNPAFNIEAMLNKKLETVGMATASAGGNVKVEMATPGFVLNDLLAMKNSAVFAWGMYAAKFTGEEKYHELVNWKDMGYGTKVPYYVLVVRKDIIAKHPNIVQTVVQLNYDATKQALTVGDYKKPELALYNAFKAKYMGAVPSPTPALVLPDAQASPVFLKDVIDYMTKCDYFKVPYTYSDLVNDSFYAKIKK